ncbi:hypothetical protein GCM10014713_21220 [Streptomyces purpureus]|uniref:Uncharacterized protein n=1 Tax=Streptomyces purpureus TaxID=1951 RepID=A0A918LMW9_9ACTN|nr:hypothetical protein GCM10014713_21220 [Streptomyces purpureus]
MLTRAATAATADQVLIPPDTDGVLPAVSRPKRPRAQGWRPRAVVKIYHDRKSDRRQTLWDSPHEKPDKGKLAQEIRTQG